MATNSSNSRIFNSFEISINDFYRKMFEEDLDISIEDLNNYDNLEEPDEASIKRKFDEVIEISNNGGSLKEINAALQRALDFRYGKHLENNKHLIDSTLGYLENLIDEDLTMDLLKYMVTHLDDKIIIDEIVYRYMDPRWPDKMQSRYGIWTKIGDFDIEVIWFEADWDEWTTLGNDNLLMRDVEWDTFGNDAE